ncbi:hypothetical protein YC2023_116164 [Brassica napus]
MYGTNRLMSRMTVRSTDWIVDCRAEYVLTDLVVISDWFWDDTEHGWRTDSSGWLVGDQAGQFGRGKRTEDVPAVREAGSRPFKWYQSDYGSRTELEGLFKICLDRTDVENAKHEHWRTDERLDLESDQVGLTLCMGKCKLEV